MTSLIKYLFIAVSLFGGGISVSADTTYRLKQVTDASELTSGDKYVFEEGGRVLTTVKSGAVQSVTSYNKSGLAGTEDYVWTLWDTNDGNYRMQLQNKYYLVNTKNGDMTSKFSQSDGSKWAFSFADGKALITNKSNENRFIAWTAYEPTDITYKTYENSSAGLEAYPYHDFTIYKLVEEQDEQYETVTITTAKFATYCSENVLDFSETGASVYTAKVTDGKVMLSEITDGIVPSNTGVIVYKEVESLEELNVPIVETNASVTDNELVGVTAETTVSWEEDGKYNYILQRDDDGVAKFFKATGSKLVANRAYLSTAYNVSANAAHGLEIVFEDNTEVTGINASLMSNVQRIHNVCYNLAGLRVARPVKGLYIASGKKFVIK